MWSAYWNIEVTPSSFFPPPHSGILFLLSASMKRIILMIWRFRPLIRGFFFYMLKDIIKTYRDNPGFRPLIRGFFFYWQWLIAIVINVIVFPSPHSGILFLYWFPPLLLCSMVMAGFRPLIRGFFFYKSPYRIEKGSSSIGFRPLIRGFFFYWKPSHWAMVVTQCSVSVPSFGDSFFIIVEIKEYATPWYRFPSPHSGILFLWIKLPDHINVSVPSFGDSFFIYRQWW